MVTKSKIERGRKIIYGEITIDEAIAEIHRELAAYLMTEAEHASRH